MQKNIILLHKDIYLPEEYKFKCIELEKMIKSKNDYYYSQHMEEHLNSLTPDRSHKYFNGSIKREDIDNLILSLHKTQRPVFEVELTKNKNNEYYITKYCCRIPYINNQDFVVAIRPKYLKNNKVKFMIVTGWLNNNKDNHITLDETKYTKKG